MKNDDAKCVERILAGDEGAFTALVRKYEKQIHAFVWRRVRDYQVAEEITQDAFLKAYQKLGTLRDPNRFSGWLYMIATRCSLAWLAEKRIPMQSLEAMDTSEIEALFYTQYLTEQIEDSATDKQREIVEYLLQKLTARERTVVALHYLSEMSCEEIGDFLELSPNTIKSRLHRARKRLQKETPIVREALGSSQASDAQASGDIMEDVMNWIQMNEPGVAASVGTLTKTSDKSLYAVIGYENIYKLPVSENEWYPVNSDVLHQKAAGDIPMAYHDSTLYIIPSDTLFASTDGGKTWDAIGSCPNGHVRELLVTEDAFYVTLNKGIFQSDDAGHSWKNMNDGLDSRFTAESGIYTLQWSGGSLFAGTALGIYRFKTGIWEHLRLPVDNTVVARSLAVSEGNIYVAGEVNIMEGDGTLYENYHKFCDMSQESWWVFRSADGGDSWTDITPTDARNLLMKTLPQTKLVASGKTVLLIGGEEGVVARSTDSGNTWCSTEFSGITPMRFSVNCAVAVDENTFYTGGLSGIHRSTDGGETWHRFNTRFECRVDTLLRLEMSPHSKASKVLYATVAAGVVKSTDAGSSWTAVDIERPKYTLEIPRFNAKLKDREDAPLIVQISEANGVLYAKGIRRNCETAYYRLDPEKNRLLPVEGYIFQEGKAPPSRDSARLMWAVLGEVTFPFGSDRLPGQRTQITFTRSTDPDADAEDLSPQIIRENPKFGAECFLKLLGQEQDDHQLTYTLMLEGLYGNFAVSGETYYMEYNYKLFRWKPGDARWSDTGVEETCELTRENMAQRFKISASGETVYVGKRDGQLFRSLDGGNSWNDVTRHLTLSVAHFNQIVFADATVHVATDKGVFSSKDGVVWHAITDKAGEDIIIRSLATAAGAVYGANDEGIYRLQSDNDTWEQVAPEISGIVTSLVVDENTFYVGTERRGVLCFKRSV